MDLKWTFGYEFVENEINWGYYLFKFNNLLMIR